MIYCIAENKNGYTGIWVIRAFTFCVIFLFLTMFNSIVGAGAVGAALRCGSDQMMWLQPFNTGKNEIYSAIGYASPPLCGWARVFDLKFI
jgi:hypothetical protein